MAELIVPAYLAGDGPRAQSGHSGDAARWEASRRLLLDAVARDGSFLDVGCANGHLLECLRRWAAEEGVALDPWGVEISEELADLARERLPAWRGQIFVDYALNWRPPRRFDFVRTNVDYVPSQRRPEFLRRLLADVVEPGGRLIVGVFNEETDDAGWKVPWRRGDSRSQAARNVPIRTRPSSCDALSGSTPGHGRKGAAPGEVGRCGWGASFTCGCGAVGLRRGASPCRAQGGVAPVPTCRARGVCDRPSGRSTLRRSPGDVGVRDRPDRGARRRAGHRGARRTALQPSPARASSPSTLGTATGASRPFRWSRPRATTATSRIR